LRYLYSLLFYILSPLAVLRLLWRSRKAPLYRQRIAERFGYFKGPEMIGGIWVHTVSVGEFLAALPFIERLLLEYPDKPIVVTTTTPTGSEQVRNKLGGRVFHVYAPYDMPCCVKRFLKKIKPKTAIFMETEIWPNTVYYSHKQDINTVIVNGRMSERSAKGYLRFGSLIRNTMVCFDRVIAQFENDGRRYVMMGLPESRLTVAGNMKFDAKIPPGVRVKGTELREALGTDRPVWIAASTREGEEALVLEAFAQIQKHVPNALLLLAPRHPDRCDEVAALLTAQSYPFARRSQNEACTHDCQVYLADTLGELSVFYAAADVVFVGGSLVPTGGHNFLEPLLLAKPVMTGPHLYNFAAVSELMCAEDALTIISSPGALAEAVIPLLQDQVKAIMEGERVLAITLKHQGSLERQFSIVSHLL